MIKIRISVPLASVFEKLKALEMALIMYLIIIYTDSKFGICRLNNG